MPLIVLLLSTLAVPALIRAGEIEKPELTTVMDYGPFLSTSILKEKRIKPGEKNPSKDDTVFATKAIVIKLNGRVPATVAFDTDTLAMAGGWTGGFLDFHSTMLTNHKGIDNCTPQGALAFTSTGPGWGNAGGFTDPRAQTAGAGPLPREWAHYSGLYLNGDRVVLSYTVGETPVLESPAFETASGVDAFTRTFNAEKSATPLVLSICDGDGEVSPGGDMAVIGNSCVGVLGAPPGARLEIAGKALRLRIPALTSAASFKVVISSAKSELAAFTTALKSFSAPADLKPLCAGGPARWKSLETEGILGSGEQPYVVDSLTLPKANPWNSWMRTTALDFFADGRMAVSTLNGDVWIVSGIDGNLAKLNWKRFATGLYEPLGLKIVDDTVYVLGNDQITRLHDLNGDGEADFYENFNNDGVAHHGYNCFAFDLQTDSEGNFFYARCGHQAPSNYPDYGCMIKVSKEGRKSEIFATGFRAANGLCVGPHDQLISGDNEGDWMPSSKIQIVKQGDFMGYMYHHHRPAPPTDYVKPLCWIPHFVDTSGGGQVWAGSDKWGPLKDHYLHTSFGKSSLMLVLNEEVEGYAQGGVMTLPLQFDSGIMRARFSPRDGQLFVCGVGGGWQTNGVRDGAIHRVRYTGKTVTMPVRFNVAHNGFTVSFAGPLDPAAAADSQNYSVEAWNYKWSEKYGSPEYSVADPAKKARDTWTVKSVKMIDDHTVFLEVPEVQAVMQLELAYKIKAADGSAVNQQVYYTINRVPAK